MTWTKILRPWLILVGVCFPLCAAAPQFSLRDSAGGMHTSNEWSGARAVVLFFVTTDCPLSNGYAPEMNRLQEEYSARHMQFYFVQGDSAIPVAAVRRHSVDFHYRCPVLLDPKHVLARWTGAAVTPQVAVLSASGGLLYLGRIDNRVERIGVVRYQATEFDLRNALDAIAADRPVLHPRTHAVGCAL